MGTEQRTPAQWRTAMATALTGALTLGVALALSPSAFADPAPADPAPPPPTILGELGFPDVSAIGSVPLLGQNIVPSAPGGAVPVIAPDLNAFNHQYLVPQNIAPAAPGEGIAAIGLPDDQNPASGRLDYLSRLYSMYEDGDLKGALLGQLPMDQLGEPLPGTAPALGIDIPPGLGQNLPELVPPLLLDSPQ